MTEETQKPQTLMRSLRESRGNPRACMLTEPMWGLPFNLYAPFASVYMIALGIGERTIGAIAAFGLAFQVLFSLLGGPITDKLGRKRATFIFDVLSWSVPTLLWAVARNASWFYLAAFFNAIVRVSMTSWTCLFIEDAPNDRVVHYWAWVYIAGIFAGVVTPLAGMLIKQFQLIPTMRVIYFFGFLSMTAKFFLLNTITVETTRGAIRMAETAQIPLRVLLFRSLTVFKSVFSAKGTIAVMVLLAMKSIYTTIRTTFFGVLLTKGLGFSADEIGWFTAIRSIIMLLIYFFVLPRLRESRYLLYLVAGLLGAAIATVLLIVSPEQNYALVFASVAIEACAMAILVPHIEGFVYAAIDPIDRARILAVTNTVVLAVASPFGWIGGVLAEMNQILPFALIAVILVLVTGFLIIARPEHGRK